MATKKPDNKSIDYYQAITAGIRNAARSRFIFRLTLTCLFLQPCDLLCLFQGLTFKQRKTANTDVYGLSQTPRVGLEPTTPRLTAACSTIELSRIILILFSFEGHTLKTEPDDLSTMNVFPSSWLSPRPISTYQLNALLHLHLRPIYLVVFKGSYEVSFWDISS